MERKPRLFQDMMEGGLATAGLMRLCYTDVRYGVQWRSRQACPDTDLPGLQRQQQQNSIIAGSVPHSPLVHEVRCKPFCSFPLISSLRHCNAPCCSKCHLHDPTQCYNIHPSFSSCAEKDT